MKKERDYQLNHEYKPGQIIYAWIGAKNPKLTRCKVKEAIKPGYTRLVVTDEDQDEWIQLKSGMGWAWYLRRNHAKGTEYEIHINQIHDETPMVNPTGGPWHEK